MRQLIFFHAVWCGPCNHDKHTYIQDIKAAVGQDKVLEYDIADHYTEVKRLHIVHVPTYALKENGSEIVLKSKPPVNMMIDWLTGRIDTNDCCEYFR